jgi:hypothetical protein
MFEAALSMQAHERASEQGIERKLEIRSMRETD